MPLKRTTKWHVQNLLAREQQWGLKRSLRHTEALSHKGKRYGKGIVNFQLGNETGSMDLINYQVGKGDIPDFQVGKGEEMSSTKSSCQQGELTDGKEVQERSHPYEDSCVISSHMNEDDEKLNTSIAEEEYHRSVLVIGGIKIFL